MNKEFLHKSDDNIVAIALENTNTIIHKDISILDLNNYSSIADFIIKNNFELNKSFKLFTKYNLELFLEFFFTNVSLFLLRSIIIYPSTKLYTLLLYKKSIIPRSIKKIKKQEYKYFKLIISLIRNSIIM